MHGSEAAPGSADLGISDELLRWLGDNVVPGSRTIETGAGLSTIVFLAAGCRHTAIAPVPSEIDAIRDWCQRNGIDPSGLDYHNGGSQDVLPTLPDDEYDLALIDGDHAFPLPIIDWYYIAARITPGGFVLVDDIQLRPPRLLRDFLMTEPEWDHVGDVGRTALFRRTTVGCATGKGWAEQPWSTPRYAVAGDDLGTRVASLRTQLQLRTRLKAAVGQRRRGAGGRSDR